jgi:hypothetical protein
MAEGALHFFEGWIIFGASAFLLTVEIYLLARFRADVFSEAFRAQMKRFNPTKPDWTCQSHAALCLSAFDLRDRLDNHVDHQPIGSYSERSRFVTFPATARRMAGTYVLARAKGRTLPALDDYILSDYSKSDGKAVNLYVAYYASQRAGEMPTHRCFAFPRTAG